MREAMIKVPHFLASRLKMASAEMIGTILEENDRAVHFEGVAFIRQSEKCLRCGRDITEAENILAGYGPECSDKIGIPRNFDQADIDAVNESVRMKTQIKMWMPRARVEIFDLDENGRPIMEMRDPAPAAEKKPAAPQKVTIWTEGKTIFVKAPFNYNEYCKEIPGYSWDNKKLAWKYFASPSVAERVFAIMLQASMTRDGMFTTPETDEAFNDLVRQNITIASAAVLKTSTDLPPVPCTKHPAWNHQLQAFWFIAEMWGGLEGNAPKGGAAMLAADMGTGKSKILTDLTINFNIRKMLIMGPKAAVAVWPKEFRKHGGREVHVVSLVQESMKNWTVARKVKFAESEMRLAEAKGLPVAICINYEAAWRDEFSTWALKSGFEFVGCDESHKIKTSSGKAARFAAMVGTKATYRLALTGTPMPNSPLDVFGQYKFLDPGIFGTNHAKFKARYGIWGGFENRKMLSVQREDELNAKFYSIAYRVGREVLDLPPSLDMTRIVQINDKARKFYKELEKELIAEVSIFKGDGGGSAAIEMIEDPMTGEWVPYRELGPTVTVENALTKLLRLQQITSGYVQDDDGTIHQIDTAKEEALEDILDDLPADEPVIVFAKFRHDLEAIQRVTEKMGRRYGEVSGRQNDLVDACMPKNVDVMGVQIQAGGAGVDLTRSAFNIYYSVGFSLSDYQQSIARSDRPGQDRSVRRIHIIAEKSVDEKVYGALENKKKIVDYVLSAF